MVDYQTNESQTPLLPMIDNPPEPVQRRRRRNVAKSIPYGPLSSISAVVQAIAYYKSWSCNYFLREIGYSSSSVHTSWLKRGTCPQWMEFVVAGWLAQRNLVVVRDKQGGVQIQKAGASPVDIQYEKVPASVPLTTKNVMDLIVLCATHGEQQLIQPLAKLVGDKNVTLDEG
jgi:hypothetical protein